MKSHEKIKLATSESGKMLALAALLITHSPIDALQKKKAEFLDPEFANDLSYRIGEVSAWAQVPAAGNLTLSRALSEVRNDRR